MNDDLIYHYNLCTKEVTSMARSRDKEQPEAEVIELEEETEEATEKPQVIRPNDLAKELGVDGKRIRAFLRASEFARPSEQKNTNWELTPSMVEAIRDKFTPSDEDELDEVEEA